MSLKIWTWELGCVWTLKNWKDKKNLKNNFFSIVWLEKSQKEKNREEKCEENLSCDEEKIFPSTMKGKIIFSGFSKITNRLM